MNVGYWDYHARLVRRWSPGTTTTLRFFGAHDLLTDLQTTLGYMHLAKGETERAIGLLETPIAGSIVHGNGDLMATEHSADQNTAS